MAKTKPSTITARRARPAKPIIPWKYRGEPDKPAAQHRMLRDIVRTVDHAADSDDPLRALLLLLAADMVEMTVETMRTGASPDAISNPLEAVIAAVERRLFIQPVLIDWMPNAPALH